MITVSSAANRSFAVPIPAVVRRATGAAARLRGRRCFPVHRGGGPGVPAHLPGVAVRGQHKDSHSPPCPKPDTGKTVGETDSVTGPPPRRVLAGPGTKAGKRGRGPRSGPTASPLTRLA